MKNFEEINRTFTVKKNLLNLNQLSVISRDWTENGPKTDRKRTENRPTRLHVLAKYAAMLLMLLTLGVGQMWAL